MAATSSYKTFLMQKSGSAWSKLVDIVDSPDLGGEPERIDVTTLSNKMRTYVEGVQDVDSMNFTANYDKTDYTTIQALAGQSGDYAVWFGGTESGGVVTPTGSEGKFSWTGTISVYVNGMGVNEARQMTITAIPSTDITFATE